MFDSPVFNSLFDESVIDVNSEESILNKLLNESLENVIKEYGKKIEELENIIGVTSWRNTTFLAYSSSGIQSDMVYVIDHIQCPWMYVGEGTRTRPKQHISNFKVKMKSDDPNAIYVSSNGKSTNQSVVAGKMFKHDQDPNNWLIRWSPVINKDVAKAFEKALYNRFQCPFNDPKNI